MLTTKPPKLLKLPSNHQNTPKSTYITKIPSKCVKYLKNFQNDQNTLKPPKRHKYAQNLKNVQCT